MGAKKFIPQRLTKVEVRRSKHKLCLFYKMSNNISPDYLSTLVPQPIENTICYNLRDASNLRQPFSRTELCYKSFLSSSIILLNGLSSEIREAPSFTSFTYQINKNLKTPRHFSVGDRYAQILHTRLRTSCSFLNQQLCSKNIVNDPHCQCGAIETTKHYLFECHRYDRYARI